MKPPSPPTRPRSDGSTDIAALASSLVSLVLLVGGSGCIELTRIETPDAPQPGVEVVDTAETSEDLPVGDETSAETDGNSDVPGDAPADSACSCPPSPDPCMDSQCVDGGCVDVPHPDGTICGDADVCPGSVCSEGVCTATLLNGQSEEGGPCGVDTDCAKAGECIVATCNSECRCEIAPESGPGCCENSSCAHLNTAPEGCISYSCDVASNACQLDPFDPALCVCSAATDCNDPSAPCDAYSCGAGACALDAPACLPCSEDAECEAAVQPEPCFTTVCGASGTCTSPVAIPGCETCSAPSDCLTGGPCAGAFCLDGVCEYPPIPGCAECTTDDDCPATPQCFVPRCAIGGTCYAQFLVGCGDECSTSDECDDADICTTDTCNAGVCQFQPAGYCAAQSCGSDGAVSVGSSLLIPNGALAKVRGPAIDGPLAQKEYCDLYQQFTSGPAPIALGVKNHFIATTGASAVPAGSSPWGCTLDCGSPSCTPVRSNVDYWMWGAVSGEGDDRVLDVAGWCLATTEENLEGVYELTILFNDASPPVNEVGTIFNTAGGLAFAFEDIQVKSAAVQPESGTVLVGLVIVESGAQLDGVVLQSSGNRLTGTVVVGANTVTVTFDRQ